MNLASPVLAPIRLPRTAFEKVWGSPLTEPWYRNSTNENIGEIWFTASESLPLLVKLLFTSDNLSIQVHPGGETGKTEMWHILRAEPGARIALGLRRPVTPAELRTAAENGAIVDLMEWIPVKPGDTFFTPAGTVHALGGGMALCEIQQRCDVTYRLYDWGRKDRELHLDQGIPVCCLEPNSAQVKPTPIELNRELLVECPYFRTEKLRVEDSVVFPSRPAATLVVILEGSGSIAGQPFVAGETWEVAAQSRPFQIVSPGATVLTTAVPSR